MDKKRTEISTLGEFGLIRHLTESIIIRNESTLKGVGDDAAVMDYKDKQVLMTTDLLLEGIHFDLTYVPLKHLGYKSAVVNFSDIYAMNGTPRQITVSLGISKRFSIEDLEELYSGIRLACDVYGVDLVGGDTSASMTGLAISITCLGEGERGKVVYRNGARETDLICVSGDLGAAYMGLQLLEREKSVFKGEKDFTPDFILFTPGSERDFRDCRYRRQRFAPESECLYGGQILRRSYLRGGMPFETEDSFVRRHSAAVVHHLDESASGILDGHGDGIGAGIHRVFHQFLDD